jgi:hypothetical protein
MTKWAGVMGNIVASLIFIFGDRLGGEDRAIKLLFYLFIAVGSAGVLIMFLLGEEETSPSSSSSSNKSEVDVEEKVVFNSALISKKAKGSATLHRDPRLFLLIPLFFYSGYEQAFVTGDFAKEVHRQSSSPSSSSSSKSLVFSCRW